MPRLRYRYLTPFGHLLIDIVVLILGISHVADLYRRVKSDLHPRSNTRQVMMLQEAGAPGWDFKHDVPPMDEFVFLGLGNPVAFIVSVNLRPEGIMVPRWGHSWDPIWFLIQELIAFPLWLAAGLYLDARARKLSRILLWFLMIRAVFAGLAALPNVAQLGSRLELLFWFALTIYLLALSVRWIYRSWRRV